jgi:hypothetical protein
VFTARYALSAYIKQIHFIFKGLNCHCKSVTERHHSSELGARILDLDGTIGLPPASTDGTIGVLPKNNEGTTALLPAYSRVSMIENLP